MTNVGLKCFFEYLLELSKKSAKGRPILKLNCAGVSNIRTPNW